MKRSLKASKSDGRSLSHRLGEFLLSYRTTPHATTNSSPGELLLKSELRTRFDLLMSPTMGFVKYKQAEQTQHHDWCSDLLYLFPGSSVTIRIYHGEAKWILETVLKKLGPVTYSAYIGDEQMVKRHIDQLCQNVHYWRKSTSNPIDDYFYSYEPFSPLEDVDPVPRNPPRLLQEERRYPQRQCHLKDRFINGNYLKREEL